MLAFSLVFYGLLSTKVGGDFAPNLGVPL